RLAARLVARAIKIAPGRIELLGHSHVWAKIIALAFGFQRAAVALGFPIRASMGAGRGTGVSNTATPICSLLPAVLTIASIPTLSRPPQAGRRSVARVFVCVREAAKPRLLETDRKMEAGSARGWLGGGPCRRLVHHAVVGNCQEPGHKRAGWIV